MEEVLVISEGCRMLDGVGEAGEVLLLRRRLVLRLIGGDHYRVVCFGVFFYLRSALFMIMILTVLYL